MQYVEGPQCYVVLAVRPKFFGPKLLIYCNLFDDCWDLSYLFPFLCTEVVSIEFPIVVTGHLLLLRGLPAEGRGKQTTDLQLLKATATTRGLDQTSPCLPKKVGSSGTTSSKLRNIWMFFLVWKCGKPKDLLNISREPQFVLRFPGHCLLSLRKPRLFRHFVCCSHSKLCTNCAMSWLPGCQEIPLHKQEILLAGVGEWRLC